MAFVIALVLAWLLSVMGSLSGIEECMNDADLQDPEDMSNTIIKVSEITSVRHYTKGWTDYLVVALSSGTSYTWSCYHYEESFNQRTKCAEMQNAYDCIKMAISNNKEYVEFSIVD